MTKTTKTAMVALCIAPVAAYAAEGALSIPDAIPEALEWLLRNKAVSVGKYTAVITMVTQIVKAVCALLGAKLKPRWTAGVVSLAGLATLVDQASADGVLNSADLSAVVVSVVSTALAFYGYKVLFSKDSAVQSDG